MRGVDVLKKDTMLVLPLENDHCSVVLDAITGEEVGWMFTEAFPEEVSTNVRELVWELHKIKPLVRKVKGKGSSVALLPSYSSYKFTSHIYPLQIWDAI
ncbi:hypothetical protein R1sor_001183 [Riccia sorocarpa]|uniref:Uncharacterized protein n=1 Tax=Riccia sorocarpa TaxID=122646 RepID=A0ABD3GX76_9MARC